MSRIKYYYDTETCKYERVKTSRWDVFLNLLGFISLVLIASVCLVIVYDTYFESPKAAMLKKQNEELEFYYEIMEKNMESVNDMMVNLQERDDHVYRTIFEAEPIPNTVRNAGVGGVERYQDLLAENLDKEELILNSFKKIDKLKRQMYIQTKSYDELLKLANNKEKMWASLPAIQPVSNKELRRLASGFGMRIHPIYKVRTMHTGIDFSAPQGTPIYSTGSGTVTMVKTSFAGYGKQIEIDHGYGIKTKYAHMSEFNVKQGQRVKRGEVIGYVGNTGSSTGPHLHYEVMKGGKKVDPIHYFYQDITADEFEILVQLASIENQSL